MSALLTIVSLFFVPALYFIWQDIKTRTPTSKKIVTKNKVSQPLPIKTIDKEKVQIKKKNLIYEGDILEELAKTNLHILFGVMSGGGKSTSMKVIIKKIHQLNHSARFYIVDPKTTDWLGLQLYDDTVFYLSVEVLEQLIQLKTITERIFNLLDNRIKSCQDLLLSGEELPEPEHDVYLIIDEWYSLYDSLKKLPPKIKAEYDLQSINLHINTIIAKGREHKVHVFLVSQTHLATETGISTAMRRSIALVGQGRLTAEGDGGYASIEGIINDSNVFKDSHKRNKLMKTLRSAIEVNENNLPIILTTMGKPRIGLLPDLSEIHGYKIKDYLLVEDLC